MSINGLNEIYVGSVRVSEQLKQINAAGVTETTADDLDFWAKDLDTLSSNLKDLANKVRALNKP
jgi:hypothetical protein